MIIGVILLGFLVVGSLGYLLGEPTPTPATVHDDFRKMALTNLQGRPDEDFTKITIFLEELRQVVHAHPDATWPELKDLVAARVPPASRPKARGIVGMVWMKAIKAGKPNDPELKRLFLEAAINGFEAGVMEAYASQNPPVPPLEAR